MLNYNITWPNSVKSPKWWESRAQRSDSDFVLILGPSDERITAPNETNHDTINKCRKSTYDNVWSSKVLIAQSCRSVWMTVVICLERQQLHCQVNMPNCDASIGLNNSHITRSRQAMPLPTRDERRMPTRLGLAAPSRAEVSATKLVCLLPAGVPSPWASAHLGNDRQRFNGLSVPRPSCPVQGFYCTMTCMSVVQIPDAYRLCTKRGSVDVY